MSPEMEQVRAEITGTRERLGETTAELKSAVSEQVNRATQAVNPLHYAREFPWAALGLAVGAGLALGLTGADEKSARAAVEGAKSAGTAIANGTVAAAAAAKDAVIEKFSSKDGGDDSGREPLEHAADKPSGLRVHAAQAVHDLLDQGLNEILNALGLDRQEVQRNL